MSKNKALVAVVIDRCDQITSLELEDYPNLEWVETVDVPTVSLRNVPKLSGVNIGSDYVSLTSLTITGSEALASLDLGNHTNLVTLDVTDCTALTALDTSACTALETLIISGSGLESVNLASNLALETFVAEDSSLTSLEWYNTGEESSPLTIVDVSGSKALTNFKLLGNFASVASIDTSGCTAMTGLEFTTQDESYVSALTSLNYEGCTAIESFRLNVFAGDIPITGALDFTNYPNLKTLSLGSASGITDINLASNTNLEVVNIGKTAIMELDVSNCTGLKEFGLDECDGITSVDLSQNKALIAICITNCSQITDLAVDGLANLEYVDFSASAFEAIALENVPNLQMVQLMFDDTFLTSLTITGSEVLTSLELTYCTALSTIDLTGCTALSSLAVARDTLTAVDVSGCVLLDSLYLNGSTKLQTLIATGCTKLSTIQGMNSASVLQELSISGTAIQALDLASSVALQKLDISNCTAVTSMGADGVNISNCTALQELKLGGTGLTSLDVSMFTALRVLDISKLPISKIDLSSNTALTNLTAKSCSFTTFGASGLNLTGCVNLERIDISSCTKFTTIDTTVCGSLPKVNYINISGIGGLKVFKVSNLTELTSIDLGGCGAIEEVDISYTKLTNFDSTGMSSIKSYNCAYNTSMSNIFLSNSSSTLTYLNVTGCRNEEVTSIFYIDLDTTSIFWNDRSLIEGWDATYMNVY